MKMITIAADSVIDSTDPISGFDGNGLDGSGSDAASAFDQVTSVSQLTDVRPTDWAFQALQSLVERYGCIVGYPDKTFRGNRALTRYEFAAGVNACLDRVNELIAAGTADLVKKAIFAVAGVAAGENALGQDIDETTIVGDRIRLNFDASFTGRDLLRT